MTFIRSFLRTAAAAAGALSVACLGAARADEASVPAGVQAAIRKNFSERTPQHPAIDEISRTPIAGLYEVRVGSEIMYVDEQSNYILFPEQGHLIDMRTRVDLTQKRLDKLGAIDPADLPLKDALVFRQGSGARRLVVFEDPNCGYCKQLERNLVSLKDVTIYTFVIPILGPDSNAKARDIVCSKDAAKTWRAWMLGGVAPLRSMGACDASAVQRNLELSRKYRVQGTPTLVFEDGLRIPSAMPLEKIEQQLAASAKKG